MPTLREEVINLSEEDYSKNPKWIKLFRNKFDKLYEKAVEESGMSFEEFAGSDKYREWVNKTVKPLLLGPASKKIFEKWEYDLLMDYSD